MKLLTVNDNGLHVAPESCFDLPMDLVGNLPLGGSAVNVPWLATTVIDFVVPVDRVLVAHEVYEVVELKRGAKTTQMSQLSKVDIIFFNRLRQVILCV